MMWSSPVFIKGSVETVAATLGLVPPYPNNVNISNIYRDVLDVLAAIDILTPSFIVGPSFLLRSVHALEESILFLDWISGSLADKTCQ